METFRGGILLLFRWLVQYPIVHTMYRLRNWTRAPFMLQPDLQDKPGILVANYGNYFYDDILGSMLAPVWPFHFVRDSLYRVRPFKWVLRFFRVIPIIRSSDGNYGPEERVALNGKTFDRVASLLRKGHWFSVFPESIPGHRPKVLKPLKPGVAHVALRAEYAAGWALGLRIYVYGTNYENKFVGRSNVFIRWAAPIEVAKYREIYERDPLDAEKLLLQEIENALHSVVLEADSLELLSDAYRLAYQQKQPTFVGVQRALNDVVSGRSSPESMHKLICRKGRESILYQAIGYVLVAFGAIVSWPFRMFGKWCASERSQEMTYQFILWILVLVTGAIVNESHWAKVQIVATWGAMNAWLWAWRRGVIDV